MPDPRFARRLVDTAEEQPRPPSAVVWLADALSQPCPDIDYVIPGILPCDSTGVLASPGGYGKTTLLFQIAAEIACGRNILDTFGCSPRRRVLFLGLEGPMEAALDRHRTAIDALGVVPSEIRLAVRGSSFRPDVGDRLAEAIEETEAEVVVLDTARRFAPGLDENSSKEFMEKLVQPIDKLRARYRVAFLLTHHERKPSEGGGRGRHAIRGTSAWVDDLDLAMRLEAPRGLLDPRRRLVFDKIRNGPDHEPVDLVFEKESAIFRAERDDDRLARETDRLVALLALVLAALGPEWASAETIRTSVKKRRGDVDSALAILVRDRDDIEEREVRSRGVTGARREYRRRGGEAGGHQK